MAVRISFRLMVVGMYLRAPLGSLFGDIWAIDDGLHHLLDPRTALLRNTLGTQVIEVPFWELVLCLCFCVQE